MYHDILLAYDGSPDSREALTQGTWLACMCNARVLLLAVVSPDQSVLPVEGMALFVEHEHNNITADLGEGLSVLRAHGLTSDIRLCFGSPAEQIAAVAREIKADLVIVGHRNQSALVRWWNGSVSASVLDRVPCSVLVAIKTPINLASVRTPTKRKESRPPMHPSPN
jgi:nucleotide-binding universal stress UspA family protein